MDGEAVRAGLADRGERVGGGQCATAMTYVLVLDLILAHLLVDSGDRPVRNGDENCVTLFDQWL